MLRERATGAQMVYQLNTLPAIGFISPDETPTRQRAAPDNTENTHVVLHHLTAIDDNHPTA